jgi:hypothetical protein
MTEPVEISDAEGCVRCCRPKTAKIHNTFGRQGTGASAVHAFVGSREAAILEYAAGQLGWAEKSKAHAKHQPPDFQIWNEAIEKARAVVRGLASAVDPQELLDYDKYWGADA